MRLLSLKIRNFRVLKTFAFSFGEQVIGIVGPNGAGKSSIIEAMAWVLWGNAVARTGKDEIRSVFAGPDEACEVELGLAMRGEEYTIRRSISAKGQTSADMRCGQALVATGVRETQEAIGRLIGLDSRGFLSSVLARQQELNALSDVTASARREKLATMLGVDRLDRAISRLKEDNRELQGRTEQLAAIVGGREQVEKDRADLGRQLVEAEKQAAEIHQQLAGQRERVKQAAGELESWQEKRGQFEVWTVELGGRREQLAQTIQSIERLSERLGRLAAAAERLPEMHRELAAYPEVLKELNRLDEALANKKLVEGLKGQLADGKRDILAAEQEAGKLAQERNSLQTQLSGLPADLADQVAVVSAERERAGEKYYAEKARCDRLAADLAKITSQLQHMDQWGPDSVCDRCHRRLGDDLVEVRGHFEREKTEIAGRLEVARLELQKVTESGTRLKERRDLLKAQQESYVKWSSRLQVIESSLGQQEQTRKRLAEQQARLLAELERVGEVVFDMPTYQKVLTAKERLDGLQREADRLSGELKDRPVVAEDLEKARKQQENLQADIASLGGRIAGLGFSMAAFEAARGKLETEQRQADQLNGEAQSRKDLVTRLTSDLGALNRKMAEIELLAEDLAVLRTDRYYGEKLVNLLAQFRQFLVLRIRPMLAELAGDLLAQMTDGRYTMVELDEQYELRVFDAGEYYGVSRFSGGEKDLANLCLRLAISQALTESAGLPGSFVILDEVFGSQDASRKDLILQALASLKGRFPQIILVTHIEDIKDRVEELIEVVPTGQGWSEVRVNGQAIPVA